jgi:hypothetical protein
MREPNKIKALGLLTPSQAFPPKYLGQGTHNLNQTVGIYVNRNNLTKHVISIMSKATAKEFGFEYLNKDLNAGCHNYANLTATNLTCQEISGQMNSTDDATKLVLFLLPTASEWQAR